MNSIVLEIPQEIAMHLKLPPKQAQKMLMEELVLKRLSNRVMRFNFKEKAQRLARWSFRGE